MEPIHLDTEAKRSPLILVVALICALAITAALFTGYIYLRRRHAENESARQQAQAPPATTPTGPPLLQIYEDDAMLKGGKATISGTVVNISTETLKDIAVELELRRRSNAATEIRSVPLTPAELAPEGQGRYVLTVLTRDFSTTRLLRVKSSTRSTDIPFKTAQGAQRPPEPPPQTNRTIVVPRPTPRKGEEEFINTPDKPARVP